MTREEAIKMLSSLFLVAEVLKVDKEKRREIKDALNMAIKALQESEIVRCGNCKRSSGNGKIGCVLNSFDNHQVHLYANDYCSRGTKKQVPKPYESEGE